MRYAKPTFSGAESSKVLTQRRGERRGQLFTGTCLSAPLRLCVSGASFELALQSACLLAVLLVCASAKAANIAWTGAVDTTWSTPGNWSTGVVPGVSDVAVFNAGAYANLPTLTAAASVAGIQVGSSSPAVTITNSTFALTVGTSGIDMLSAGNNLTFSGTGAVTLGGAQTWTVATGKLLTAVAVSNGAFPLTVAGAGNVTVSGVLGNGAGSLTMNSTGVLTLSAANTYTGMTTIHSGTLTLGTVTALGPAASANVSFDANSTGILQCNGLAIVVVGLNTSSPVGTPIVQNGHASTAATIRVNNAGANTFAGTLRNGAAGTLGLIKGAAGTLTLSTANTYTAATVIDQGTLAFTVDQNLSGGLTFGAAAGSANAGNLDLSTNNATFAGAMLVQYTSATGGTITIGSGKTLTINSTVTIGNNTGTTPATKLTATGGGAFVVSNTAAVGVQIGGATTAGNANTATLDLSGLGTFTASLSTTAGIFRVNNAQANNVAANKTYLYLPTAAPGNTTITVQNFDVGDSNGNVGTAGAANCFVYLGSGANIFNVVNFNIGTQNRDCGSVTFAGSSGTYKLRGVNGTSAATLFAMATGGTNNQTGVVGDNTFNVTGHSADILVTSLNVGNSTRNTGQTNTFSFDTGALNATTVQLGFHSATGGTVAASTRNDIMNLGGGTVTIGTGALEMGNSVYNNAGAHTVNATVNVSGGTVTIANSATLAAAVRMSNNSTAAPNGSVMNSTLNITGGTVTVAGHIIKGAATGTSNATLTLNGGALDMGSKNIGGAAPALIQTLNFQSGTLQNVAQINNGAAQALTKTTAGTLTLAGTNAFTGGLTLSAGTLNINSTTALGAAAGTFTVAAGTIDNTSGGAITLANNNPQAWNGDFAFAGSNGLNLGTGNVALNANRIVTASANTLTVGGVVSGGFGLTKSGGGTLALNGANTYTGTTTINAGAVTLGSATALGPASSAAVIFGASSTGTLNVNGQSVTLIGLTTDPTPGNPTVQNANASSGLLTVNNAADGTYAGVIQDGTGGGYLALTKGGAGTLILNAANNPYTGATNINGGTLEMDGIVSSHMYVNSTATLTGTGSVNGMDVFPGNTGTISPGTAGTQIATLTNTGDVTLGTSAGYIVDLDGLAPTADLISAPGKTVTLSGTLTIAHNTNPAEAQTYTIVSAGTLSGTFTGAPNGGTVGGAGRSFTIHYNTGANPQTVTLVDNSVTCRWTGLGGDGQWGTAANWNPVGVPPPGSSLVFGIEAGPVTANNNISADFPATAITFTGTGYTLTGLSVDLGVGGIACTSADPGSANTLAMDVLLTGAMPVNVSEGKLTMSGAISGAQNLSKSGAGTLVFSGGNTYSGSTTIADGTLQVGSGGAGGALGTGGTTNNAALVFDGSASIYVGSPIGGTGTLTQAGLGTLTLNAANNYTGATTVSAGLLVCGIAGALPSGSMLTVSGGTLDLAGYSQTVAGLSDGGSGLGIITDSGAAATLTVNTAANSTYSGALAGTSLALTKAGAGNLTLSGTNTYEGATTLQTGGYLIIGGPASLPSASPTTVQSGGTLQLAGSGTYATALTLSGAGTAVTDGALVVKDGNAVTISGAITLAADATIKVRGVATSALNITGGVSGSFNLATYNDANPNPTGASSNYTLVVSSVPVNISAAKTWTGKGLLIDAAGNSAGTLLLDFSGTTRLGVAGAFFSSPALTFGANATNKLDLYGQTLTVINITRNAASGITDSSTGAPGNLIVDAGGNSPTYADVISGNLNVSLISGGTLTLSAANTYTGGTTVSGGTLKCGVANAMPPATATAAGTSLVVSGGTFDVNGLAQALGSLSDGGSSSGIVNNSSATAVTLTIGFYTAGPPIYTIPSYATTFSGIIKNTGAGALALTKNGAGRLTLSGVNTFTGAVTVNYGPLWITNSNGLGAGTKNIVLTAGTNSQGTLGLHLDGSGGAINLPSTFTIQSSNYFDALTSGSIFNEAGSNTIAGPIQMTAGGGSTAIFSNAGTLSLAGTVTATATLRELHLRGDGNGVISGVISDGSTVGLNVYKDGGAGTWIFTAANTYTGATSVTAGTLQIGQGIGAGNLGAGPVTLVAQDAILRYNHSDDITVGNVISGTGALTQAGVGMLTLTANNTYTGATTVNSGKLVVNGYCASGSVAVNNGATLGGTGMISGAVTVTGSTLSPGSPFTSPGVLSTGALTFDSASTLVLQLNGTAPGTGYDALVVTGAVNLNNCTLNQNMNLPGAKAYSIVHSTGGVSGTFNNYVEGATTTLGASTYTLTYLANGGKDVVWDSGTPPGIFIWNGGGLTANWTEGANWTGGTAPSPGDILVFGAGPAKYTANNDFPAGTGFVSIELDDTGYTLTGNSVVLTGGATAVNSTYGDNTISLNLAFALNAPTLTCVGGGSLFVNGTIANDGLMLTLASDGIFNFNGTISGMNGLTMNGNGLATLTANNTYCGVTSFNAGTVLANASDTVKPFGTSSLVLNGGTLKLRPTVSTVLGSGVNSKYITQAAINMLTQLDFAAAAVAGSPTTQKPGDGVTANVDATNFSFNAAGATSVAYYTGGPATNFAVEWTAMFMADGSGTYTFTNASDDASRLYIDNMLVLNNEGGHGIAATGRSGGIYLNSGLHYMRLQYCNGTTNDGEILSYSGPNTAGTVNLPWAKLSLPDIITLPNNVTVNSGNQNLWLVGSNFTHVSMGSLTLNANANLQTIGDDPGKTLNFAGTTLNAANSTMTIGAEINVGTGLVSNGGNANAKLAMAGTAALILDNTAAASNLTADTVIDVPTGRLIVRGSTGASSGTNNPLGAATIQLSGGTLTLDAKVGGATFPNNINVVTNPMGGSTIETWTDACTTVLSGTITVSGGQTLTVNTSGGGSIAAAFGADLTISGQITGTGNLVKTYTNFYNTAVPPALGVLLLSNANNNYVGSTTVTAGTLRCGVAQAVPANTALTVASASAAANFNATFDLYGLSQQVASLSDGGGVLTTTFVDSTVAGTPTLTMGSDNSDTTFGGVIRNTAGTLSLFKTGTGTLTLSGTNTFAGTATIGQGTISSANFGNAFTNATLIILSDGTNKGTLAHTGGTGTFAKNFTVNAGGGEVDENNPVAVLTLSGAITANGLVTVGGPGSTTLSGVVSGAGGLAKVGAGTLLLSTVKTYGGGTTVSEGTLKNGVANALPTGTTLTVDGAGGVYDLAGFGQQVAGLLDGGVNTGTVTNSGATAVLTVNNAAPDSFSSAIIGAVSLAQAGAGTLTLTGANSYAGVTTINPSTTLQIGNGGTSGTLGIGGVANSGTLVFNRSDNISVGNVISGTGGLTQSGSGILGLSGANSYTGPTIISAGTLQLAKPPAFNPMSITGCLYWLDASDASSLALNGSTVSAWNDKSGNNNNFTQATVLQQPAYVSSAMGGLPVVRFSAGNDNRLIQTGTTAPYTVFIVNKLTALTNGFAYIWGQSAADVGVRYDTAWRNPGNAGDFTNPAGSAFWINGNPGSAVALNTPHLLEAYRVGGASWAATVIGDYDPAIVAGTRAFGGDIAEIVAYSGALTTAQREAVEGYLLAKWVYSGAAPLPSASPVQIASGATLDLNGINQSILSLADSGGGGGLVTSSAAGPINLTISSAAGSTSFSGTIQNGTGTISLVKSGGSTQVLAGSNTYNGSTAVNGGTLQLAPAGTLGGTTGVTISQNAILSVDNTGLASYPPGRILQSAALTINGGTFSMAAPGDVNCVQNMGTITFGSGSSSLILTAMGAGNCQLITSAAAPTVNTGATLSFVRTNATAPATGTANFGFTSGTSGPVTWATVNGAPARYDGDLPAKAGLIAVDPGSYVYTVNNGNWEDGNVWSSGLAPASNADVIIRHNVTLATAGGADASETVNSVWFDGSLANGGTATPQIGFVATAGALKVSGGYIQVSDPAAPTISVNLDCNGADGVISQKSTGNMTIAGMISNTSANGLAKGDAGKLTLLGANTYSGGTTIGGGTLQVGNNGTSGQLGAGAVTDNGTLIFNRSDSITVGTSGISGTGNLTMAGAGTLTLTAGNTYSGTTTVNAGTLLVNASSSVNPLGTSGIVLNGGNLALQPTAASVNGVASKYISQPTTNILTLLDFGTPAYPGSPATQNQGVTVAGPQANFIFDAAPFYTGAPIINYAVEWTGMLAITTPGTYTFSATQDDATRLYVDNILVLDADKYVGGPVLGAPVTLTAGYHLLRLQYAEGTGGYYERFYYSGPDTGAVSTLVPFARLYVPDPISLGNNVTVNGGNSAIQLLGTNFTNVGLGGLTLNANAVLNTIGDAAKTINFTSTTLNADNATVTINANTNVYTGVLSNGPNTNVTLAKGGGSALILDNTLSANNTANTVFNILSGRVIARGSTGAASGTNNPLGTGAIQLSGGTLTLDTKVGGPTYANPVTVNANSAIEVWNDNQATTVSGTVTLASGTLTLNTYSGSIGVGGGDLTISGQITGSGSLAKTTTSVGGATLPNPGRATISNNTNNYSGTTTVNGGQFVLAVANGLGNSSSTIVNPQGELWLSGTITTNTAPVTLNGVGWTGANGGGGALINGAANNNTLAGPVTLGSAATIYNNQAAVTLTLSGLITANYPLTVNGGTGTTFSGRLTGTATLTKNGAGTLTLSAANNDYSGATTVNAGTLSLFGVNGAVTATPSITVNAATLKIDNTGVTTTYPDRIPSACSLIFNAGSFTMTAVGVNCAETVGPILFNSGSNTITLAAATTFNAQLITTATGLSQNNGALLNFIRTNVTGTANLGFTGGTAGSSVPWAFVSLNGGAATRGIYDGDLPSKQGLIGAAVSTYYTVADGDWENTATWNGGVVPPAGSDVMIRHQVYLANNAGVDAPENVASALFDTAGTNVGVYPRTSANTLTVTSGSIFATGTVVPTINVNVDFGGMEGVINQASTGAMSIGGVIGNGAGLMKVGTGVLTLSGANTYTGGTVVGGGTLQVGNGGASGTLGSGAVLNNGTLIVNRSGSISIADVISGSGTLTKLGTGTLTLGAANTYTGATAINAGTLAAGIDNAIPSVSVVTVGSAILGGGGPANLDFQGFAATLASLATNVDNGDSNVSNVGSLAINGNCALGQNVTNTTAASNVSTLTVVQGGTLSIGSGSANSATLGYNTNNTTASHIATGVIDASAASSVQINVGILRIGFDNIGASPSYGLGKLYLPTGTSSSSTITASDSIRVGDTGGAANTAVTQILNFGYSTTVQTPAFWVGWAKSSGNVTITPGGTVTFLGATEIHVADQSKNATTGTVSVCSMDMTGGSLIATQLTNVVVGKYAGTGGGAGQGTLVISPASNVAITALQVGVVTTGACTNAIGTNGSVTINGGTVDCGTVTLGSSVGNCTAVNANLIINGGAVTIASATLGTTTGLPTAPTSGTIQINGGTVTMGGNIAAGTDSGGAANTARTITLNGGTLDMAAHNIGGAAGTITQNFQTGVLQNVAEINNGGGLIKNVAGTLTLTGANTYTGGTNVTGGTLSCGLANVLPAGSALTVSGTGTFDLDGLAQEVGGLADGGVNTGTITNSGAAVVFTVSNAGASAYSGAIAGALALTKTGAGTLALGGVCTYSGATTVNQGKLLFDGSLDAASSVAVNSGAALGGTGTIAGTVTSTGGTVSPGSPDTNTGILGTGTLTFDSASTFDVQMNSSVPGAGCDQLNVTGSVNLNGCALNHVEGLPGGLSFTLIHTTGGVVGTFNGIAEGDTLFTSSGRAFRLTYLANGGNDVVVSTAALNMSWTGNSAASDNWTDGANWVAGTPPVPGDSLLFGTDGVARLITNTNDFTAGARFPSIKFEAAGYQLNGNNLVLVGGAAALNNNVAGANTINNNLGFAASAGTITSPAGGALTVAGALDNGGLLLTVDSAGSTSLGGVISGTGGLAKLGAGTLTLTGASTYTGATTVSTGTLLVNGSQVPSAVSLDGGTLGGTGTAGPISATPTGGTVAPGLPASIGILSGSTANLSSNANLFVRISGYIAPGTDYDQLNLSGALTTGGTTTLTLDLNGLSTSGVARKVVAYSGGVPATTFANVALINNLNSYYAALEYGASGLDVALSHHATHFAVGMPVFTIAGAPFSVTVAATDAGGNTDWGYVGTVHFTSTDPAAVLPADYTFVPGDFGAHTFTDGATLFRAGAQTVALGDGTYTGSAGITVDAAGAVTLVVSGFPSPVTAGTAGGVTVTAKDLYGNIAAGYTGTVHFTSTDAQAALPLDYTFVVGDAGTHAFTGEVTLKTAGSQTITATDTVASTVTGAQPGIVVNPAAVNTLLVSGFPSPVMVFASGSVTVTAKDLYGNTVPGYAGTVHFTSSDLAAALPADSLLVSGTGTFSAALNTAGTQSISATDTVTSSITGTQSGITVNKATPTITWANPADIAYGTALGAGQLNATASVPGTLTYTPPAGTVLPVGAGQNLHVDFVPTDTVNYNDASKDVTINVLKATPTITWANPADIVYGTALDNTQLNATAGVPGTLTYTPPAGTVLSAGLAQNLHVDFVPTDTANYNNASKDVAINVLKATPTITWANPADIVYGTALGAAQLNADAGVPGVYTYTPPSGTVLPAGAGHTLHVDFVPTDTANYSNASADAIINVLKATPTITWANPADIVYGTPLGATQLNATASVPGTMTYTPPATTVLNAGPAQNLHVDFVPTDSANYNNASKDVTINVLKATPVITLPPDIVYPTPLPAATVGGGVPGTLTQAPLAGTVLSVGSHTVHVDFVPDDTANYSNVSTDLGINVHPGTPVITWANPADITYPTPLDATQLNATASVPGVLTYTPPATTVLSAGLAQNLHVDFTPTDTANYNNASKDVTINVLKATPVITWPNPADIVYGTPLGPTQLDITVNVPGTMTYTPPGGTVLNAGLGQTLHVDFVPTDTVNYGNASKDVTINVLKATPTITWANPADIMYPTPLGATQLNATANVPGTMTYTPASGTVLPVGNGQTLHVSFVPTDTANYNNASKDVPINVLAPSLTITACETQDTNGNGYIDAIRIVTSTALNDNFAGLSIAVAGYTVVGYDTGGTANDNVFFVRLAESGTPDTGATPPVEVLNGGGLGLPPGPSPVATMDKAKPVLISAAWFDGSGAGVDANDPIYLTFSEPVTSNTAQASDFGLPVTNDAYGTGATVSDGQNTTDPKIITITLGANPLLTPGGLYGPGALTPGSPSGTFVADGTRVVDAAGNTALIQTVGTAVDIQPGTESVSICWDDLTVAPKNWNVGSVGLGGTYYSYPAFPPNGLVARNNGNVREKFTASVSASSPSGWVPGETAGVNQFKLRIHPGVPPFPPIYPLDLSTGPKDIATQLYSGYNQPFDIEFGPPTSVTSGAGVPQTITVTITATKD